MRPLLALILLLAMHAGAIAEPSSCAGEATLVGRTDILHCEQWSSSTWWQNGYKGDGTKSSPPAAVAGDVSNTSIVSDAGCISGTCLRVDMAQYQSGALAVHWPLSNAGGAAPDELYMRYYLTLGSTFDPRLCASGNTEIDNGGKFPGLADVRTNSDPSGQCGNGGDYSDGINCWSGRLKFRNCKGSGDADICTAGGTETTRLGWYWYVPPANGANNQTFGAFDHIAWGTDFAGSGTTCSSHKLNLGSTGTDANASQVTLDGYDSASCGKGRAGLKNSTRYRIELHVKMNTPGSADGKAEAWVFEVAADGSDSGAPLKYLKSNMEFRLVGHDNLHVRTIWLNVHAGGEFMGLCTASYILLDQLVVGTKRIGAFRASGSYRSSPTTLQVN